MVWVLWIIFIIFFIWYFLSQIGLNLQSGYQFFIKNFWLNFKSGYQLLLITFGFNFKTSFQSFQEILCSESTLFFKRFNWPCWSKEFFIRKLIFNWRELNFFLKSFTSLLVEELTELKVSPNIFLGLFNQHSKAIIF